MAGESLLEQAFAETGVQLDRIIDAYERTQPPHPETIVWYNDNTLSSFEIEGELECEDIPNIYDAVKVEIGNIVTTIGEVTFDSCSELISITIPDSVTSIGGGAFGGCFALTSVTIPDSVTSIGGGVFASCEELTSITIPNNVTSIGDLAFDECPATVIFEGRTKTEVQALNNFRWGIGENKIICTDGTL